MLKICCAFHKCCSALISAKRGCSQKDKIFLQPVLVAGRPATVGPARPQSMQSPLPSCDVPASCLLSRGRRCALHALTSQVKFNYPQYPALHNYRRHQVPRLWRSCSINSLRLACCGDRVGLLAAMMEPSESYTSSTFQLLNPSKACCRAHCARNILLRGRR